jgi:hypothetical protein
MDPLIAVERGRSRQDTGRDEGLAQGWRDRRPPCDGVCSACRTLADARRGRRHPGDRAGHRAQHSCPRGTSLLHDGRGARRRGRVRLGRLPTSCWSAASSPERPCRSHATSTRITRGCQRSTAPSPPRARSHTPGRSLPASRSGRAGGNGSTCSSRSSGMPRRWPGRCGARRTVTSPVSSSGSRRSSPRRRRTSRAIRATSRSATSLRWPVRLGRRGAVALAAFTGRTSGVRVGPSHATRAAATRYATAAVSTHGPAAGRRPSPAASTPTCPTRRRTASTGIGCRPVCDVNDWVLAG